MQLLSFSFVCGSGLDSAATRPAHFQLAREHRKMVRYWILFRDLVIRFTSDAPGRKFFQYQIDFFSVLSDAGSCVLIALACC